MLRYPSESNSFRTQGTPEQLCYRLWRVFVVTLMKELTLEPIQTPRIFFYQAAADSYAGELIRSANLSEMNIMRRAADMLIPLPTMEQYDRMCLMSHSDVKHTTQNIDGWMVFTNHRIVMLTSVRAKALQAIQAHLHDLRAKRRKRKLIVCTQVHLVKCRICGPPVYEFERAYAWKSAENKTR